jgi:hypothetical protein
MAIFLVCGRRGDPAGADVCVNFNGANKSVAPPAYCGDEPRSDRIVSQDGTELANGLVHAVLVIHMDSIGPEQITEVFPADHNIRVFNQKAQHLCGLVFERQLDTMPGKFSVR